MNYNDYIGQKVIIRSDRAGVFFGIMKAKEGTEVELSECRRIWYWSGAGSISEIAVNGVSRPEKCKFSVTVPRIVVTGVIEIIPCSDKAVKSIESVKVWKMSK